MFQTVFITYSIFMHVTVILLVCVHIQTNLCTDYSRASLDAARRKILADYDKKKKSFHLLYYCQKMGNIIL